MNFRIVITIGYWLIIDMDKSDFGVLYIVLFVAIHTLFVDMSKYNM